jgi:hypothetical protein
VAPVATDDGIPSRLIARLNRGAVRLFRNNAGVADYGGAKVRYGLLPGSGDLIGWRSVTITPDMVGQRVAIFVSIECKAPRGRVRQEQARWHRAVTDAGGISAIVRTEDAALAALGEDAAVAIEP